MEILVKYWTISVSYLEIDNTGVEDDNCEIGADDDSGNPKLNDWLYNDGIFFAHSCECSNVSARLAVATSCFSLVVRLKKHSADA